MKTIFVKPLTVVKKWYLIDAEGKELGRVAVAAARILRGKNKPEYVTHQDLGDFVIIINAAKAARIIQVASPLKPTRTGWCASPLFRWSML